MCPICFNLSLLPARVKTKPIKATNANSAATEKDAPPADDSAIINAEIVVPIFAPIMTEAACERVISPTFTKPTIMTVVAEELLQIAVTAAPVQTPIQRFLVALPIRRRIDLPAAFSILLPIIFIPIINTVTPPRMKNALLIIVSISPPVIAKREFII